MLSVLLTGKVEDDDAGERPSAASDPSRIERPPSMSSMRRSQYAEASLRRERAQEAVRATAVDRVDEQVGQLRQPPPCLCRCDLHRGSMGSARERLQRGCRYP